MNKLSQATVLPGIVMISLLSSACINAKPGAASDLNHSADLKSVYCRYCNPRFTNAHGKVHRGTAISIDPSEVIRMPRQLARRSFTINKIYRVQEGVNVDDLFIVDDLYRKWNIQQLDSRRGIALESGKAFVWGFVQKF